MEVQLNIVFILSPGDKLFKKNISTCIFGNEMWFTKASDKKCTTIDTTLDMLSCSIDFEVVFRYILLLSTTHFSLSITAATFCPL